MSEQVSEIVIDAPREEVVITEANFQEYFFDVRTHQPQRGQVIARYAAAAEFIDGGLKRDLVDYLCLHEQPDTVIKLMRKIGCATERDSISIPLAMARDLLHNRMSPDEVAKKPYRFVCEAFFYTKKEHIPLNDPHWTCVSINNLDEFLDAKERRISMKTRVLTDDQSKVVTDANHILEEQLREDAEKPADLPTYAHYEPAWNAPGEAGLDDPQADTGPVFDSNEDPA